MARSARAGFFATGADPSVADRDPAELDDDELFVLDRKGDDSRTLSF